MAYITPLENILKNGVHLSRYDRLEILFVAAQNVPKALRSAEGLERAVADLGSVVAEIERLEALEGGTWRDHSENDE